MEFKLFFTLRDKLKNSISHDTISKIGFLMFNFTVSLICTRGIAFGNYAPFPVALVASVPRKNLWVSVLGAVFGYLLPSSVYMPFRYMATIITVAALRWTLSELTRINTSQFFAPTIAFIPLLATGVTMSLLNHSLITVSFLYVAESFLAAGCAYFFSRSYKIITEKRYRGKFDNVDIASMTISLSIIVLSLTEIEVFTLSIGRILMLLLILTCAGAGGISGGAISGITAGAITGLSSFGLSYLSGAYGLGGLMAGIFAPTSKLFSTLAFIVAHGIASLQISDMTHLFDGSVEVALASVIYMIVPENKRISNFFALKRENISGNALRNNIIMRLNHNSKALLSVSDKVDEISQKLIKSNRVSISQVYNSSTAEICSACSLRAVCWKKKREDSIRTFASLTPKLKANGKIVSSDFPEAFSEHCSRTGEICNSVNKFYKAFLARQKAEVRASDIRDIASEQFKVTSAMLTDMAGEISLYESFDEESADRVLEVFRRLEIYPLEICCRRDRNGRLTVEAEIEKSRHQKLNKGQLVKEVSKACAKRFSPPCISNTEYSYKIQMCQKTIFDVCVGMAQHSASKLCGDSVITFYDGQGRYISILSDGMGTGGLAAIDGAMASSIMESLLKAGMGYDTTLRLVNSALMSKSEDESLATIDIVSLDLYTGKCEFRKAGASFSVVRRGKKVYRVEEDSLPVGIMDNVQFSLSLESFKAGDIICMLSDGVTSTNQQWLNETILNYQGTDPNELASTIVSGAKQASTNHTDDITAVVIMVCNG